MYRGYPVELHFNLGSLKVVRDKVSGQAGSDKEVILGEGVAKIRKKMETTVYCQAASVSPWDHL